MPVSCSNCATSNRDSETICTLCGAELKKEVTVTDPAGPAGERTGSFEADIRGIVIGGTVAGRYLVKAMLGRGGVAMVFRAQDNSLREEIALKVFPNLTRQDPADLERFKREVLVNRRISHVNVIRVYDFGTVGDDAYLTMELLDGGTLAEKIEAKPLPIAEAVEIAIGIAEGLQAAHQAGIIHRDVKPENVLFDTAGRPKLVDFGLARLTDASTHTKGFSGTPFYMSPEQAEGAEITVQTDVYSLGVLLFELFTGQLPFFADSLVRIAMLHVNEMPPRPSELRPGLPVALEQLVLASLAKKPESRPQGVGAVAASLRKFRRDGGLDSARGLDADPSFSARPRRARMPSDNVQLPARAPKSEEKTLDNISAPGKNRETVITRVDREGSSAPRPVLTVPPREREGSSAPRPIPSAPSREQSGARPVLPRPDATAIVRDLAELPLPGSRAGLPVWLVGAVVTAAVVAAAFFGGPVIQERLRATPPEIAAPLPFPGPIVSSVVSEGKPAQPLTNPLATTEMLVVGAPTPEGFGIVELSLAPWGFVSVDGEKKEGVHGSQEKYEFRVRAGTRELRVKNDVFGFDERVRLNIRAGRSCKFATLFLKTKPELVAPPGCIEP